MNSQCVTGGQLELLQKYGVFVCPCALLLLKGLRACTLMSWFCFAFLSVFIYMQWWGGTEFVLCRFFRLSSRVYTGGFFFFFLAGESSGKWGLIALCMFIGSENLMNPHSLKNRFFLDYPVTSIVLSIMEVTVSVKSIYSCFLASLSHMYLQENAFWSW